MIQLLIDTSYISHRAHWSTGQLEFADQQTGVFFGVFNTILDLAFDRRFLSNQFHFFFDSKQSIRRAAFPDYKRKRYDNRTPEQLAESAMIHAQVKRLYKEILPSVGFPCYRQWGLESDDVMAMAAKQISTSSPHKSVMITADNDLFQCIGANTSWYDPARRTLYDPMSFWSKFGVYPEQWGNIKSLCGCNSDNVPGIPGIGETRATAYVTGEGKLKDRWRKLIESPEGKAIINRNQTLVKLPHLETQPVELTTSKLDPTAFWQWCRTLGVKSYMEGGRERQWKMFFEGNLNEGIQIPRMRGSS